MYAHFYLFMNMNPQCETVYDFFSNMNQGANLSAEAMDEDDDDEVLLHDPPIQTPLSFSNGMDLDNDQDEEEKDSNQSTVSWKRRPGDPHCAELFRENFKIRACTAATPFTMPSNVTRTEKLLDEVVRRKPKGRSQTLEDMDIDDIFPLTDLGTNPEEIMKAAKALNIVHFHHRVDCSGLSQMEKLAIHHINWAHTSQWNPTEVQHIADMITTVKKKVDVNLERGAWNKLGIALMVQSALRNLTGTSNVVELARTKGIRSSLLMHDFNHYEVSTFMSMIRYKSEGKSPKKTPLKGSNKSKGKGGKNAAIKKGKVKTSAKDKVVTGDHGCALDEILRSWMASLIAHIEVVVCPKLDEELGDGVRCFNPPERCRELIGRYLGCDACLEGGNHSRCLMMTLVALLKAKMKASPTNPNGPFHPVHTAYSQPSNVVKLLSQTMPQIFIPAELEKYGLLWLCAWGDVFKVLKHCHDVTDPEQITLPLLMNYLDDDINQFFWQKNHGIRCGGKLGPADLMMMSNGTVFEDKEHYDRAHQTLEGTRSGDLRTVMVNFAKNLMEKDPETDDLYLYTVFPKYKSVDHIPDDVKLRRGFVRQDEVISNSNKIQKTHRDAVVVMMNHIPSEIQNIMDEVMQILGVERVELPFFAECGGDVLGRFRSGTIKHSISIPNDSSTSTVCPRDYWDSSQSADYEYSMMFKSPQAHHARLCKLLKEQHENPDLWKKIMVNLQSLHEASTDDQQMAFKRSVTMRFYVPNKDPDWSAKLKVDVPVSSPLSNIKLRKMNKLVSRTLRFDDEPHPVKITADLMVRIIGYVQEQVGEGLVWHHALCMTIPAADDELVRLFCIKICGEDKASLKWLNGFWYNLAVLCLFYESCNMAEHNRLTPEKLAMLSCVFNTDFHLRPVPDDVINRMNDCSFLYRAASKCPTFPGCKDRSCAVWTMLIIGVNPFYQDLDSINMQYYLDPRHQGIFFGINMFGTPFCHDAVSMAALFKVMLEFNQTKSREDYVDGLKRLIKPWASESVPFLMNFLTETDRFRYRTSMVGDIRWTKGWKSVEGKNMSVNMGLKADAQLVESRGRLLIVAMFKKRRFPSSPRQLKSVTGISHLNFKSTATRRGQWTIEGLKWCQPVHGDSMWKVHEARLTECMGLECGEMSLIDLSMYALRTAPLHMVGPLIFFLCIHPSNMFRTVSDLCKGFVMMERMEIVWNSILYGLSSYFLSSQFLCAMNTEHLYIYGRITVAALQNWLFEFVDDDEAMMHDVDLKVLYQSMKNQGVDLEALKIEMAEEDRKREAAEIENREEIDSESERSLFADEVQSENVSPDDLYLPKDGDCTERSEKLKKMRHRKSTPRKPSSGKSAKKNAVNAEREASNNQGVDADSIQQLESDRREHNRRKKVPSKVMETKKPVEDQADNKETHEGMNVDDGIENNDEGTEADKHKKTDKVEASDGEDVDEKADSLTKKSNGDETGGQRLSSLSTHPLNPTDLTAHHDPSIKYVIKPIIGDEVVTLKKRKGAFPWRFKTEFKRTLIETADQTGVANLNRFEKASDVDFKIEDDFGNVNLSDDALKWLDSMRVGMLQRLEMNVKLSRVESDYLLQKTPTATHENEYKTFKERVKGHERGILLRWCVLLHHEWQAGIQVNQGIARALEKVGGATWACFEALLSHYCFMERRSISRIGDDGRDGGGADGRGGGANDATVAGGTQGRGDGMEIDE